MLAQWGSEWLPWLCLPGPSASPVGPVPSSTVTGESVDTSPVIHLVTDAKGTVIHEVHVQMQELPLGIKGLGPEVGTVGLVELGRFLSEHTGQSRQPFPLQSSGPEELGCAGESGHENLLRQAMQNSGIVLERGAADALTPAVSHSPGAPELPLLGVGQVDVVGGRLWVTGPSAPRCLPGCVPSPVSGGSWIHVLVPAGGQRGLGGPQDPPMPAVQRDVSIGSHAGGSQKGPCRWVWKRLCRWVDEESKHRW